MYIMVYLDNLVGRYATLPDRQGYQASEARLLA
jgi:hypothetical protein